jgi:hypothetical protein
VCLNLSIPKHHQANGESQCESTILAGGVSRIINAKVGPPPHTSQAETTITAQRRRETIFRRREEAAPHRRSYNL